MESDNIKILAIDDNFDNLITIQALIGEFFINAEVILATSGKEGIELAESMYPDVILLDVIMPDLDGFEVCKILKDNSDLREIPVVFVTALKGDKESRIKGLEVGGEAFLAKPIDESELIAQIRAMLKIKNANLKRKGENERLAALIAERTQELNRTHLATLNLLEDLKNENEARKKTEAALRASEEKFRDMANFLPQVIFELDNNGLITYINEQVSTKFGYLESELIGQDAFKLLVPEQHSHVRNLLSESPDVKTLIDNEYQMVRKDGSTFPALIYTNAIIQNNERTGVRGILVDITTQKEIELNIRESERKYRLITEKITDVVWVMDLQGNSSFVSQSIEKFTGFSVAEYLEQSVADRFTQESSMLANQLFKQEVKDFYNKNLNASDLKRTLVLEYLCKDGSTKFGELLITPYLNESNELIGIHGVTRDITKRTKTERKLLESEEQFREMAEMLPQMIFESDKNGLLNYVNKQAYKLLGFTEDDAILGTNFLDYYSLSDRSRVQTNMDKSINDDPLGSRMYTMLRKDGSSFPALVYSNPIIRNDETVGLRGIIVDITEQVLAEKAVKESESLYRAILEASPDYIIITDVNGNVIMASPSALEKYKYNSLNQVIGSNVTDFIVDVDQERMLADFNDILNGIRTGPYEYGSYTTDGEFYEIEVKGGIITDTDGNIVKIVFIARDVTERKLTQAALEKSETKYREFVENSPEAIAIYTDGIVSYVNQECMRLMRASSKDQLIGMNVIEFIHPDNRASVIERMQQVPLSEMNASMPSVEEKYIRLDGTPIYVEVKVMPLIVDDKMAVQLTARDITERKLIREALEESENRYNTFINNNVDMIFVKDDQLRYLVANQALADFFGLEKQELIGKTDLELATSDTMKICSSSDKQALLSSSAIMLEEKINTKVFETIKFPMQLSSNKNGVGGIMRDITVRKQIEDALERSRTELKTIYDNAPVMMCLIDEDRKVLFSNHAFSELTNKIEYDLVNQKIGNVVGCENATKDIRGCGYSERCKFCNLKYAINETFNTGIEHRNIDYVYQSDKTEESVEYSLLGSTALIENAGKKNILLCLSDITDRKLTEEALQKSEMILRTFIDNVPFEIWARDNNGVGILENSKMVERFGSIINKKTDITNDQNCGFRIYPENYKRVFKGEIIDEECEYLDENKKTIFQQIIFPIFNKLTVNGIAGINIDITERKEFEEALHESQVQLKKFAAHLQDVREEEKVLLAREIHDELGQILIALKIDMGMLKQSVLKRVDEIQVESVSTGFNNIFNLIDTTIKTARKIMTDLRPEVLELLGFSDAIKFHAKGFQERHKVKCTFKNRIKDLELDNQQSLALFRIIQEALNNVAKHARATEVKINLYQVNENFLLEISDNGVGFDVDNGGKQESYGLIGMKERVFLLDGDLSIRSKKNEGTRIRIEMPYKKLQ